MDTDNDICNLLQSDLPSSPPSSVLDIQYKREWDEYFNYDFDIRSINNGIFLPSSFQEPSPNIDLKMSNAVTFSFRKKETLQSENFDNDYLVTVENVNFNTEEEDDPFENENLFKDRIKPFVDYKEIATRFVNDLYKNANIDKIEPCDQLSNLIGPNVIDKRNEELNEYKNRRLKREIEFKDEEIYKLNDKLSKCKYQNQIVLDENKKLLEIIHLFKMMNEIDNKKKITKEIENDIMTSLNENDINLKDINIVELEKLINLKNSEELNESKQSEKSNKESITSTKENRFTKKVTRNRISTSHSKKDALTSEYSNSYLFKEKKCYITISTPSTIKTNRKVSYNKPKKSFSKQKCKIPLSTSSKTNPFYDVEKRLAQYANNDYDTFTTNSNLYSLSNNYTQNTNTYHKYIDTKEDRAYDDILNRLEQYKETYSKETDSMRKTTASTCNKYNEGNLSNRYNEVKPFSLVGKENIGLPSSSKKKINFNNIKIPHSGNRTTRINNPKKQINF